MKERCELSADTYFQVVRCVPWMQCPSITPFFLLLCLKSPKALSRVSAFSYIIVSNWQLGLQFDVSKVCLLPWNTAGNAGHRLGGAPAFERTQKDAAAYSARCVAHLGSAPAPASRRMLSA